MVCKIISFATEKKMVESKMFNMEGVSCFRKSPLRDTRLSRPGKYLLGHKDLLVCKNQEVLSLDLGGSTLVIAVFVTCKNSNVLARS